MESYFNCPYCGSNIEEYEWDESPFSTSNPSRKTLNVKYECGAKFAVHRRTYLQTGEINDLIGYDSGPTKECARVLNSRMQGLEIIVKQMVIKELLMVLPQLDGKTQGTNPALRPKPDLWTMEPI